MGVWLHLLWKSRDWNIGIKDSCFR